MIKMRSLVIGVSVFVVEGRKKAAQLCERARIIKTKEVTKEPTGIYPPLGLGHCR